MFEPQNGGIMDLFHTDRAVESLDPIDNVKEEFSHRQRAGSEMAQFVSQSIQLGRCVTIQVCDGDAPPVVYTFNAPADCGRDEAVEACPCPEDVCMLEGDVVLLEETIEVTFEDVSEDETSDVSDCCGECSE